ncbi:ribose 5-phosphate isomerase [Limosilactobacillus fermentum]|nr:ribose 5-phosphate isomerase [Limosilactobacillus fermentum]
MNQQDSLKQLVGQTAAKLVKNGMIVGLGTGSTVRFLVDALGKRVQEEGLAITGVTTSNRTTAQATSLGIKIVDLDDVDHVDLTIDGADEVDRDFYGIKGAGVPSCGKRSSTTPQPTTCGLLTNPRWLTGLAPSGSRWK